ncbi:MAG: CoA-binding protein [Firmicutes bacterium]|nr:CoA-binding protein [Bacillota bacterium]
MKNPPDARLKELLVQARTIAVVGLSANEERASHRVARYLKEQGYRVIPVNPAVQEVLGEKAYAALEDIPEPVDIVDVFRKSEDVPPIAESAVKIGAKVLWQQEGVTSEEAANFAAKAGLEVVMDCCLKLAHQKLLGAMNS